MTTGQAILVFDSSCNLCHGFARFVDRRDPPPGKFRFASFQSPAGRRELEACGVLEPAATGGADEPDSLVLVEHHRAYVRSTAALRVLRRLGLPWCLLYALIVVPRPVRDWVYRWVARRRYRWCGRRAECAAGDGGPRARLLK